MNITTAAVIVMIAIFAGCAGLYTFVAGVTIPHVARLGKVVLGGWLVVLAAVAVIGLVVAWGICR